MSSPIASVLITPAEAAALARANQIEALASKSAEGATSPEGTSFAAALEAATSSQGAGYEAGPEPEPMPNASPEALPSVEAASNASELSGGTAASISASQATGYPAQAASGVGAEPAAATASTMPAAATASTMPAGYAQPTATAPSATSGAGAYEALIQQAAARNGVDPAILHGLIEQESGFNPDAHSSAGALGLTQLMPSTAASLGVTEPLNPTQSIEGGARLLGELLRQFGGNVSDALAAYNAGAGAVQQYGGVPPYPETEAYVSKVLANAQSYGQAS